MVILVEEIIINVPFPPTWNLRNALYSWT